MTEDEGGPLQNAITQGPEIPDELKRRFDEQIEGLLSHRLSASGRIVRILGAILMGAAALYCAWLLVFGVFLMTGRGIPLLEPAPFLVLFIAAFLLLATGAFYCVYELRRGIVAPRRVQRVTFGIRHACLFVMGFISLILVTFNNYGAKFVIVADAVILFVWSVFALLALYQVVRWNREDILVEMKRTQLQIALLEERLSKAGSGPE
jgi:hypothetical protein